MDNIIKDMYFGNVLPFWEIQHRTKEYDEKIKANSENSKRITRSISRSRTAS